MKKYRVQWLQDEKYQVILTTCIDIKKSIHDYEIDQYGDLNEQIVHQGSLSECESYIRLKEGGYM